MGCDVHCYIEVKDRWGNWYLLNQPRVQRDYGLFEKMAGVRGEIENAIFPPRGLPKQLSIVVTAEDAHWGVDGHSHSWFTMEEMDRIEKWYKKYRLKYSDDYVWPVFGFLFGNGFDSKESLIEPFVDCRMVFWFDN